MQYKKVEQKILSFAKQYDCEDLIEYDNNFKEYYPTKAYEDGEYRKLIEKYDNDTFWDELADRLSLQNLIEEVGEEKYKKMDPKERLIRYGKFEEKYHEEFKNNGLKNIKFKA